MAFLAGLITAVILAACSTESLPTVETVMLEPTAQSTAAPTPTPKPYEEFETVAVPAADPDRLARFTTLLSLVPESYGSALYLDMEFLRSDARTAGFISPEILGLDLALPSIATGLVNAVAVAADLETHAVITPFQGDFTIPEMIRVASGFGLPLREGGEQPYEGHDVWEINALGSALVIAAADDTTGVAASAQDATGPAAVELVKASLDAFDGRSGRLLDAPVISSLVGDVPSGFAAMVLSQCESLRRFSDIQALPGCTGAVATASMLPDNLVVLHALIGFPDQEQAQSAVKRTAETLRNRSRAHGFEDLGVRQEGNNLRVRVIVDVSKFTEVFQLFAPSQ